MNVKYQIFSIENEILSPICSNNRHTVLLANLAIRETELGISHLLHFPSTYWTLLTLFSTFSLFLLDPGSGIWGTIGSGIYQLVSSPLEPPNSHSSLCVQNQSICSTIAVCFDIVGLLIHRFWILFSISDCDWKDGDHWFPTRYLISIANNHVIRLRFKRKRIEMFLSFPRFHGLHCEFFFRLVLV